MKFTNLTPHEIKVVGPDGSVVLALPPSGQVARVAVSDSLLTVTPEGVEIFTEETGEVTGLPEGEGWLVVSLMVRKAAPEDVRLFSPGELVRNEAGQPIGCRGLRRNQFSPAVHQGRTEPMMRA